VKLDVLSNEAFVAQRSARERGAVAAAAVRRVSVGPNLTLLFENRDSVLWQIQEMCRVEHITAPTAVQHEVDTYAALLPGPAELSATLLVEYPDPAVRDPMLRALVGLHARLRLEVDGVAAAGRFDGEQFNAERISSVQFVRFPLGASRAAFFDLSRPVRVVVDHPRYQAVVSLPPATRGALVQDLLDAETVG